MRKKKKRRKIARILPPVGTELEGKFFTTPYYAAIVKSKHLPSGKGIKFNNKVYASLTAAAQAITKQPTNGWRFWKVKRKH